MSLRADLFVVSGLVVVAAIVSLAFSVDLIASVLLYLGAPTLYLSFRRKKNFKKIALASLLFGVLLGMAYNFVAEFNYAWAVVYQNAFLNYHIVGKTPIGDFIWAFLIPFSILIFYEHFLDDEKVQRKHVHYREAFLTGIALFAVPLVYLVIHPAPGTIAHAYLIVGLISTLPLIGVFFGRRKLVTKLLLVTIFFTALNLTFEVTALMLGQWHFPGEYIGWVDFAGVTFPLEELLFWIIPSTAVFVFSYEMIFDDGR